MSENGNRPPALVLGLLAESYVHPGSGQSEGAVDLPVARERTTDYPFVPGSGVKGAVKDAAIMKECAKALPQTRQAVAEDRKFLEKQNAEIAGKYDQLGAARRQQEIEREKEKEAQRRAREAAKTQIESYYGKTDNAGELMFSDAKLLLLPVRSLSGAYRWLTCPYLIERWQRDLKRVSVQLPGSDLDPATLTPPEPARKDDPPTVVTTGKADERLFLEERVFEVQPTDMSGLAKLIGPLVGGAQDPVAKRLAAQLAVVRDEDFGYFARFALPVHARNVLDDNKVSRNLWYEEALAPDTLLYTLLLARRTGALQHVTDLLGPSRPYLQLGGNETVGQGWFRVAQIKGGGA